MADVAEPPCEIIQASTTQAASPGSAFLHTWRVDCEWAGASPKLVKVRLLDASPPSSVANFNAAERLSDVLPLAFRPVATMESKAGICTHEGVGGVRFGARFFPDGSIAIHRLLSARGGIVFQDGDPADSALVSWGSARQFQGGSNVFIFAVDQA